MEDRDWTWFGVAGPTVAYASIGASIALSPWFRWERNALSDLGHSVRSGVAPIYNFGLLVAGFLIVIYAATVFKKHAKYTSASLSAAGFFLQMVATFDEVYGSLHYVASVLFFVSIGVTSIVYAVERKSYMAVLAFAVGLASWVLYWMKIYVAGVAVPETISSVAAVAWIIQSAIKIYHSKQTA